MTIFTIVFTRVIFQVWYNADGFLDKNRDTLRPDVVELLISSRIPVHSILVSLFGTSFTMTILCIIFTDDIKDVPGSEESSRVW